MSTTYGHGRGGVHAWLAGWTHISDRARDEEPLWCPSSLSLSGTAVGLRHETKSLCHYTSQPLDVLLTTATRNVERVVTNCHLHPHICLFIVHAVEHNVCRGLSDATVPSRASLVTRMRSNGTSRGECNSQLTAHLQLILPCEYDMTF